MVLSGGPMIHGLPKRPVTVLPPTTGQRPSPSASSSATRLQIPLPATQALPQSQSPQAPPPLPTVTPPLDASATVLLSQIMLPERPLICYRQFGPVDGVRDHHLAVELVRRSLVKEWEDKGILDTWLTVVRVERQSVSLWVFIVTSDSGAPNSASSLEALQFEEMHAIRSGRFTPRDLYPCSPQCNHPTKGCDKCDLERPPIQNNVLSTCLLPRSSLRLPFATFLDALRGRLIDKISQQQCHRENQKEIDSPIMRLNDGFLLGPQAHRGPWEQYWGSNAQAPVSKLVHCQLHLSLLPTRLLVQPVLTKAPLLPLSPDPPAGTPVVLLPYGTPAYYLGPYIGPKDDARVSFQESLRGLGCRSWEGQGLIVCWLTVRAGSTQVSSSMPVAALGSKPPAVQERGSMVVWPLALCFHPTSTSRQPLTVLPSIPSSVCQPISPPRTSAPGPNDSPSPLKATGETLLATSEEAPSSRSSSVLDHSRHSRASSLGGIKALSVDAKAVKFGPGMDTVALEMGSYVEWAVKEREREKERVAKEKEREREKARRDVERPESLTIPNEVQPNDTLSIGPQSSAGSQRSEAPNALLTTQRRPQGSVSHPEGYYPSPPEFSSTAAPAGMPSRTSILAGPTYPVVEQSSAPQQQAVAHQDWNMDAATGVFDLTNASMSGRSSGFDTETVLNMTRAAMGIDEEFTEDDFNFFDVPPVPQSSGAPVIGTNSSPTSALHQAQINIDNSFNTTAFQPTDDSGPSWMEEFLSGSQGPQEEAALHFSHNDSSTPAYVSSSDVPYNTSTTIHQQRHDSPITSPAHAQQSQDLQHSHSSLPRSPLRTPEPSTSASSPYTLTSSEHEGDPDLQPNSIVDDEEQFSSEFPFRLKEYVAEGYQAVPFPAALTLASQKYTGPSGKFNLISEEKQAHLYLSTDSASEGLIDESAYAANQFLETVAPRKRSARIPLPSKRLAAHLLSSRAPRQLKDEVEGYRKTIRARLRKIGDKPARQGDFEIWRSKGFFDKFSADTDPRMKLVKRLRGQKRRLGYTPYPYLRSTADLDPREPGSKLADFEDLVAAPTPLTDEEEGEDSDSESSTFATDGESVFAGELDVFGTGEGVNSVRIIRDDDDNSPAPPESLREMKTPPPPSNVPVTLGASLLHTLCHPAHVVALTYGTTFNTTLAPAAPSPAPVPMSVPTPVSPAAHTSPAGESAVLLEAAANVTTRELVENPAWALAYSTQYGWTESDVVQASSVDSVAELMRFVPDVQYKTSLHQLIQLLDPPTHFEEKKTTIAQILKPPMIATSQAGVPIQLGATSLRFWDKLGLSPLGGSKDVVAFALYEEESTTPEHVAILSQWMEDVCKVYAGRRLGTQSIGGDSTEHPTGLIPFKWESVKKTLSGLIRSLPGEPAHVVLYFVTTPSMTVTSVREFRQLSAALTHAHSGIHGLDGRVLVHFVPKSFVYDVCGSSQVWRLGLEKFVQCVYDRLLRRVERIVPRQIFKRQSLKSYRFFQSYSWTLARRSPNFSFKLVDWPPASTDVVDRHAMLHVAYEISECSNFVMMCGVDAHGEAHDARVVYIGGDDQDFNELDEKVVGGVMAFVWDFCSRTNAEWNVVIARPGPMTENELIAWEKCLLRDVISQDQAIHVAISCIEVEPPLLFLAPSLDTGKHSALSPVIPHPAHSVHHTKWMFTDISSTTMVVSPYHRIPLVGINPHSFGPDVLSVDEDLYPSSSTSSTRIGLLPLCSSYLVTCPPIADRSTNVSPGSTEYTMVISSLHFHVLHTCGSRSSSMRKPLYDLQDEILRSYSSLAVLSRERWSTSRYGGVPFHLAAVLIMKGALSYSKEA
ncbi:hypothetical protein FRB96_000004 [Tulasnella sp. 330]|nr:hypothetical protein FRB96_000004 [Tulasnella sp. 330]